MNPNVQKFKLIRDHIEEFNRGVVSLKAMKDALKRAYWEMESPDDEWRDVFFEHWGLIEELYALTVSQGQTKVPDEWEAKIRRSLEQLANYASARISGEKLP